MAKCGAMDDQKVSLNYNIRLRGNYNHTNIVLLYIVRNMCNIVRRCIINIIMLKLVHLPLIGSHAITG